MNHLGNSCIDCSLKSKAVSILDRNELGILEEGCSKVHFQKGELIFKEGTPAQNIIFVRRGLVKLTKKGAGNKDFILSITNEGHYLGIQNLSKKSELNYFSAIAVVDSEVCCIQTNSFERLLKQNGVFASEVITTIFNDEMNYFDRLVSNVQQQLPGRLAGALLYFQNEVYNSNPFVLNLTKAELASLIGTSRESVSRLLKEFNDSGLIRSENNRITILNDYKLKEIKQKG